MCFDISRFFLIAICLCLPFIHGASTGATASTQIQTLAYVASTCNGKVLVFDTTTNTIVDTVSVGIAPFFVAVSPDAKRVYVSNRGSHTVSVIDAATREVVSTIATAQVPGGLAVTPDGSRVYLATVSGTILVIDTNSNAVVATIQDSVEAFQVAITPDGTRAYVTHGDLSLNIFNNTVSVIDIATNTIIASIPVGFRPSGVVITPDSARAYVANDSSGTVSVIDTPTNTVIDTIPTAMAVIALAITSDGAKVYATTAANSTVTVIDTSTNTVTSVIQLRHPSNPSYLAVTPDDARVYVSNGPSTVTINEFDVIDTATDKLTAVIPNPDNCSFGIAMAPLIPQTKDDCTNGGYRRFRSLAFRNQGQCIKYVEHGK